MNELKRGSKMGFIPATPFSTLMRDIARTYNFIIKSGKECFFGGKYIYNTDSRILHDCFKKTLATGITLEDAKSLVESMEMEGK